MMQREGLSFSDYFDDSVPYEVKPVPCLTPMEEESSFVGHSDVPTQSKDLFKGLWEDTLHKNREYWLDPQGMIHRAIYGHEAWAQEYLSEHGIPYNETDEYSEDEEDPGCYYQLFIRNFVRLYVDSSDNTLHATYRIYPNTVQMRKLKDSAIESQLELMVGKKYIDLTESKYVNKDGRSLFIESMMPDNMDVFKSHLVQLFAYLQKELQLKTVPSVKLISDEKNADKVLGKTAYYNPDEKLVVLYTTNRHQKDILRSFAHEIIHHWQHENEKLQEGESKKGGTGDPQYAQNNPWLRQMEKQAYLLGNMLFRDWEDKKKAEDKKSGNDGKGGRVNKKVKEQHGKGNVRFDSHTPIMKQKYSASHPYRKHTEGPQDGEIKDVKETTYSLGNEYPPKKMDYRG